MDINSLSKNIMESIAIGINIHLTSLKEDKKIFDKVIEKLKKMKEDYINRFSEMEGNYKNLNKKVTDILKTMINENFNQNSVIISSNLVNSDYCNVTNSYFKLLEEINLKLNEFLSSLKINKCDLEKSLHEESKCKLDTLNNLNDSFLKRKREKSEPLKNLQTVQNEIQKGESDVERSTSSISQYNFTNEKINTSKCLSNSSSVLRAISDAEVVGKLQIKYPNYNLENLIPYLKQKIFKSFEMNVINASQVKREIEDFLKIFNTSGAVDRDYFYCITVSTVQENIGFQTALFLSLKTYFSIFLAKLEPFKNENSSSKIYLGGHISLTLSKLAEDISKNLILKYKLNCVKIELYHFLENIIIDLTDSEEDNNQDNFDSNSLSNLREKAKTLKGIREDYENIVNNYNI